VEADTRRNTAAVAGTETDVAGVRVVKVTVTAAERTTEALGSASISYCPTKISASSNGKVSQEMTSRTFMTSTSQIMKFTTLRSFSRSTTMIAGSVNVTTPRVPFNGKLNVVGSPVS
jgi:hypothetical protein